jgi:CheY-like chemotaxis protein
MSILLVEDSERIRALVRSILSQLPVPIVEAETAERALAVLQSRDGAFELLITDLAMPGMSGLELASRLRLTYPQLRVLCITGHDLPAAGVEDVHFIQKPFRPDELLSKVRELLALG